MMSDPASLFQDIEGSEFSVFDNLDWSQFRVGTLLIELHAGKGKLKSKPVQELHEFISRIEKAGFLMYSMEPVTKQDAAQVEVAFVHRDWTPSGEGY